MVLIESYLTGVLYDHFRLIYTCIGMKRIGFGKFEINDISPFTCCCFFTMYFVKRVSLKRVY